MGRGEIDDSGGVTVRIRIGKVTNIYPSTGKVRVMYEDENSTSLPLSMLTMNQEYSMPAIGERVVTIHMENGSSKGFVLGTYYGSAEPKASVGYRKDFEDGAYAICKDRLYRLFAGGVSLTGSREVILESDEVILIKAENVTLQCSYGTITAEEIIKRLERIEDQLGIPHVI